MTLATGEKFSQPALGTVQDKVKGIQEPLLCPAGVHHKSPEDSGVQEGASWGAPRSRCDHRVEGEMNGMGHSA